MTGDGYSLEEARNKREEDKLLAAADAKKQGVRAYVQELRKWGINPFTGLSNMHWQLMTMTLHDQMRHNDSTLATTGAPDNEELAPIEAVKHHWHDPWEHMFCCGLTTGMQRGL
jgi:hypothetical protein